MFTEPFCNMDTVIHRFELPPAFFASAFISLLNLLMNPLQQKQTVSGVCFLAAPERYFTPEW